MKIASIAACLVIAVVILYTGWSLLVKKDYRVGEQGMESRYQPLLSHDAINSDWEKLNCTVQLNNSLAQVLHVVREGGRTNCVEEMRGELYSELRKPFLCNDEDAARIDNAVRQKDSCEFPLETVVNSSENDYYAFVLMCVVNMTDWKHVGGGPCPVEYPQSVVYAVVDDAGKVFY
ncbi:MAG: hypothetical protein Sv326_0798 [Candidatus Fermentimicrarchaeum limneticum]|uniref:Uncharacterized protein n=1 Tax=Fermentimicrarchaeum limneticum TaxID=2795018 RepID=A0A7D5XF59_FERL1|nr:MAG: hypothetical protein Sv326_0798 [Candidatus Fermentimicrarchaeum limneticum]